MRQSRLEKRLVEQLNEGFARFSLAVARSRRRDAATCGEAYELKDADGETLHADNLSKMAQILRDLVGPFRRRRARVNETGPRPEYHGSTTNAER